MGETTIAGYDYGEVKPSPVTREELELLKRSVLFGPEDEAALRRAGEVLGGQVEDVLDVWYGFVGANPHLLAEFSTPEGEPVTAYLERVRGRFGQWIRDTCARPYDDAWLAYQEEIAERHTPEKKNKTDGVTSVPYVPLRYLIALIYPITATVRDFLAKGETPAADVDAMHEAWRKSVIMQVALWSRPYATALW
ncbi:protoglobin domain-containing protein [Georgenia yuyongxinii]|uniref:Protogloblin ApPgb n=1 Tax=Georgenia yuyongxinii TaxID=2589797 RepID=A0A552WXB9_9MICO|nr:protoglobin domain-containing protein [Georgenia yuyongxinii]TRW47229.1 protogloblin ApPgb [Georgenia yuyongxinii]